MGEKNPRQLDDSIKMSSFVAKFLWKIVFWNITRPTKHLLCEWLGHSDLILHKWNTLGSQSL